MILVVFLSLTLCANKSWRPWRWRISTFELWKDYSFRLNRFRASRPAHFKPLSIDQRRLEQVPRSISADGVRTLIARMKDSDIEAVVEEARRTCDARLMGGDHYRMDMDAPYSGGSAKVSQVVENEAYDPATAERRLNPIGMDPNDPVVQLCMAEVRAILRKLRDVDHVVHILGRLPNHRRAQRMVLSHPQLLGGYFDHAEHKSRGSRKHFLWVRMLGVLEHLPPQMPVRQNWVEESDVETLSGLKFVMERLLASNLAVSERTGRNGAQIRTLMTEALRALEQKGLMHGIRQTLRTLNPPREPKGDPRKWMQFLDRKGIGNRRVVWCHPNASLPHEEKKKLEVLLEIPDVEIAPSAEEITNMETALKHRYADAVTEWLTDSTTFLEIGLMVQRVLVVHHMVHNSKPTSVDGEWIESERLTPMQIWDELSRGKGASNVKDYGNLESAANMLAFLDPEGIREHSLAFKKLLESDIMKRYFLICKEKYDLEDGTEGLRFYCRARFKAVQKSYVESTCVERFGRTGRQPTRLIDRLQEHWAQNVYMEDENRKGDGASTETEVTFRDRYDPRKDALCEAYTRPYAKTFSLFVFPSSGLDEYYFYKVENRFDDAPQPSQPTAEPGARHARPYQVTPVHPTGDIGPFIDLSELGGLPKVHGESAWGRRTFDFFDEQFRFNKKHKKTTASPIGFCLNLVTRGGWVRQRQDKDGRIRGLRVKAKISVQEPAVRVSEAGFSASVRRYRGNKMELSSDQPSHDNLLTLVCIVTINIETEVSMTWFNLLSWAQGHQRAMFGLQRRVLDLRFCTRKYGPDGKAWGVSLGAGLGASHAEEQEDIRMLEADGGTVRNYDPSPDGLNRLDAFQRDEFRKELRTLCRLKIPESIGIPLNISLYPDIYTNPDVPELCQTEAKSYMNFWNEHLRPARGSVIARVEWDGPLVEREMADLATEMIIDEREAQKQGKRSNLRDEVLSDPSNTALVQSERRGAHRRIGKEPWYYPSEVFATLADQLSWVYKNIGFHDWERTEHKEEAVEWAATLGFNKNFYRDCALEVRLDSTTAGSNDYVYRSRRATVWGMRPTKAVDDPRLRLEFLIGCTVKSLPGRMFEHLAEVAVAARWVEIMAIIFLTSVIFWKQNVADAHLLEIRENEYCTNEAYELTQCWATNATFYFELYDSAREFVNCTGATADFQRMICFLPPSGQEFDAALLISGIGVSYSVFKAITIALAFGLFRMCPSGRRGIDTTVFLIFFTVFATGALLLVYGILMGTTRFTGQYDLSVMSSVLVMAVGLTVMVHAIKYRYKHDMVLWEIENFDFGSVSDDDFATRRLRIPFAVTSYSMPGLARDDEFVSANKPWKSKWYTDRTLRPSTLLSSNPAGVSDFTLGANGGDIPRESYLELDDGSKYSC